MSDLLQRIGTFKVERDFTISNPEKTLDILKDVLIVKTDYDFATNSIVYIGFSKHFDITEKGMPAPRYNFAVDSISKKVKWNREDNLTKNDVKSILEEIKDEIKKVSPYCKTEN